MCFGLFCTYIHIHIYIYGIYVRSTQNLHRLHVFDKGISGDRLPKPRLFAGRPFCAIQTQGRPCSTKWYRDWCLRWCYKYAKQFSTSIDDLWFLCPKLNCCGFMELLRARCWSCSWNLLVLGPQSPGKTNASAPSPHHQIRQKVFSKTSVSLCLHPAACPGQSCRGLTLQLVVSPLPGFPRFLDFCLVPSIYKGRLGLILPEHSGLPGLTPTFAISLSWILILSTGMDLSWYTSTLCRYKSAIYK